MKKIITLTLLIGILATQSLAVCASSNQDEYVFEHEINDDFDCANTKKINSTKHYYIVGSLNENDVDIFKLVGCRSGRYHIEVFSPNECDVIIYDQSKRPLDHEIDVNHKVFRIDVKSNEYVYLYVQHIYDITYNEPYRVLVKYLAN